MKVAIIGGGYSGLSCAWELEKYGITPDVFERDPSVDETYPHVTAVLNITHRTVKDAFCFFADKYKLELEPLKTLNEIVHTSPHNVRTLKGNFGYLVDNYRGEKTIKMQLYNKLKASNVIFNVTADYKELEKAYDYVVIATGDYKIAKELGCWQLWTNSYVKGAYIEGSFKPHKMYMWINQDFSKHGYAYMTPFDEYRASIINIVSDVNESEVDSYWDIFYPYADNNYNILEEFKLNHQAGYVYPLQVTNKIFVGNSAGGIDPYLGFGLFNSVVTGISAARTIAKGVDYEAQIKDIIKRNLYMRQFRKTFNVLSQKDYDKILAFIGVPGIKQLLYDSNFNVEKAGAGIARLLRKKIQK